MNTLVFDIETIPDTDFGRRHYNLDGLDDNSVAKVMYFKQRQARQTDFLPLVQYRIVVVSALLRTKEGLHLFSLADGEETEKQIVERFFEGLERYSPELISWNGSGFDLPVLHYRALKYGVTAEHYWEIGDADREFRFNNYLNRFHWRHLDLMDVLSGYNFGGRASLEQAAMLLGLPGKLGMRGDRVWDSYRNGEMDAIRDYCEMDVLNTYLIYLRFQLMRGLLDQSRYQLEVEQLDTKLSQMEGVHISKFLSTWRSERK
ncbi:MAG: 3'-5' exonuclease [Gammaproteobacteria bacterium]